jgi:hypothetical protein
MNKAKKNSDKKTEPKITLQEEKVKDKKVTDEVVETTTTFKPLPKKKKPTNEQVKVFMRRDVTIKGLKPMTAHIRYLVPKDRLPDFPKGSFVIIDK